MAKDDSVESLSDKMNKQGGIPWYLALAIGFGLVTIVVSELKPKK